MHGRHVAAGAGRWSVRHPKTAVLSWLGLVVACVVLGNLAGLVNLAWVDAGTGESRQADRAVGRAFGQRAGEQVLIQSRGGAVVTDPAFQAAIGDVADRLRRVKIVTDLRSPLATGLDQVSRDRHSALLTFSVKGKADDAADRIGPALAAVARAEAAHPGFRMEEFGDASASHALAKVYDDDLARAEHLSLPITLFILVIAFGALVAAVLPLVLGLTAVMAAMGLIALLSHAVPMADSVSAVVVLVGLAVGVDYSMFYVRRERDERRAGRDPRAAIEAAAATSGRAVLISGTTVMIAMAGMYVIGHPVFAGFATGTIVVVALAMIGSVTFVPGMLALLGDRLDRGRVPFLSRLRRRRAGDGVWSAVVDRVLRHPWLSGGLAATLLIVLALPALRLHTAEAGWQGIPQDLPIMQTYSRIQAAFPGGPLPAVAVSEIPPGKTLKVLVTAYDVRNRALATGLLREPFVITVSPDRRVVLMSMAVAGKGTDGTSTRALAALRDDVLPATLDRIPGVRTSVTGDTAASADFNALMRSRAPLVFVFVLSLAFLLLLVTFRSIVVALKAVVLNLLSVGAAYGVLVWIFQDGRLQSLLDYRSFGGITTWLPLFLFVVLFGLSMDYHVFILSRVKEGYDGGMRTPEAVAHGIKSTAGVVTSAAAVMVAVFGIFATLGVVDFKLMGIGFAVAVLIDATVIRAVLLPAAMTLLDEWNWYLPRWLQWLPAISFEPPPQEPAAPEVAAAGLPAPAAGAASAPSAPPEPVAR